MHKKILLSCLLLLSFLSKETLAQEKISSTNSLEEGKKSNLNSQFRFINHSAYESYVYGDTAKIAFNIGIGLSFFNPYLSIASNLPIFINMNDDSVALDLAPFYTHRWIGFVIGQWYLHSEDEKIGMTIGDEAPITLGYGNLVLNFSDSIYRPLIQNPGMKAWFKSKYISTCFFTNSITDFDILGSEIEIKPLAYLNSLYAQNFSIGVLITADLDPYHKNTLHDSQFYWNYFKDEAGENNIGYSVLIGVPLFINQNNHFKWINEYSGLNNNSYSYLTGFLFEYKEIFSFEVATSLHTQNYLPSFFSNLALRPDIRSSTNTIQSVNIGYLVNSKLTPIKGIDLSFALFNQDTYNPSLFLSLYIHTPKLNKFFLKLEMFIKNINSMNKLISSDISPEDHFFWFQMGYHFNDNFALQTRFGKTFFYDFSSGEIIPDFFLFKL